MQNAESDREEGEIVDDELEDVSDCTISSPFHLGKSVSAAERLRSVSLSSISDKELETSQSPQKMHEHCVHLLPSPHTTRPHRKKRKRKHSRRDIISTLDDESDEEERLDRKMLQQLKEAVRIENSGEVHQNSLRARLKGLIEPIVLSAEENKDDLVVNNNGEEVADVSNDKELEELRLEALKSAMLKKHFERKRRKALEEAQKKETEKLEGGDVNKENTIDNSITTENSSNNKQEVCSEETKTKNGESDVPLIEEDVDIMRAMLLASMSKKITEASTEVIKKLSVTQPAIKKPSNIAQKPIKRTIKTNYFTNNKVVNNARSLVKNDTFKPTTVLSVEPLIINLNNDSDSDMDIEEDEDSDVAKSVTNFLNQQRAEVEAAKKAEEKTATDELPIADKSAMKLLPFSQQIEYHRLKQQLQAKRVKMRKNLQNVNENKTVRKTIPQNDKVRIAKTRTVQIRSKFTFVKQNNLASKERVRVIKTNSNNNNKIEKNNSNSLQRTLSDMQTQKDGRLQVKGKYQELVPILKKVNQVSVERKRYENEIKRLLQELEKTKHKFNVSHQSFKALMEDLMRRKEAIDKRTSVVVNNEVEKDSILCTPLKNANVSPFDGLKLPSSTPIDLENKQNCVQPNRQEEKTEKDIHDIVDPNDLDEHIMNQNRNLIKTSCLPKYVSPLDKRDNDIFMSDPLAMLCPFELLGVCKDKDCTYQHCS